jgi:hypothetical protein
MDHPETSMYYGARISLTENVKTTLQHTPSSQVNKNIKITNQQTLYIRNYSRDNMSNASVRWKVKENKNILVKIASYISPQSAIMIGLLV